MKYIPITSYISGPTVIDQLAEAGADGETRFFFGNSQISEGDLYELLTYCTATKCHDLPGKVIFVPTSYGLKAITNERKRKEQK